MIVPEHVKDYVDRIVLAFQHVLANGECPSGTQLIDGKLYIGPNITRYYLLKAQELRRDLDDSTSKICTSTSEWTAANIVLTRSQECMSQLPEHALQEIRNSVRCYQKLYSKLLDLTLDESRAKDANAVLDFIDRAVYETLTDSDFAEVKIFKLISAEDYIEKVMGGDAYSLKIFNSISIAYRRIPIFKLYAEKGLDDDALDLIMDGRMRDIDAMNLWFDCKEIIVYYISI